MSETNVIEKPRPKELSAVLRALVDDPPPISLPRSVPIQPKPVSLSAQISFLEEELAQAREGRDSYKLSAALNEQEVTSLTQRLKRETARAEHMTRKFTTLKTLLEAFIHFQHSGGTMLADAMSRSERDFYGEGTGTGESVGSASVKKMPEVDLKLSKNSFTG
jgi:hypothetical protein